MKKMVLGVALGVLGLTGVSYANDVIKFVNKTDQDVKIRGLWLEGDLVSCGTGGSPCIGEFKVDVASGGSKNYKVPLSDYSKTLGGYLGKFGFTTYVGTSEIKVAIPGVVFKIVDGKYKFNIMSASLSNAEGASSDNTDLIFQFPKYSANLTQFTDASGEVHTQITFVDVS
ncbi:hypothetical protein LO80_05160 [Candidatus Francisella endociliophora]|uniref:Uncharacterized protein n=1 Tax=Candidatus Francisella endociliophora TaxID=653937 RepID=A0A097EPC3_9GAMM|nr:hypothetical protein [Francisella sp. FSC1006]AIT09413.1 hypothetical protein LO80_05160 [Francisella sp. FSC1006]